MATYALTASNSTTTEATPIEAENDQDAMFSAIAKILNRAHENPEGIWGKGEIILKDEAGDTVAEMAGK